MNKHWDPHRQPYSSKETKFDTLEQGKESLLYCRRGCTKNLRREIKKRYDRSTTYEKIQ